jgi:hypothetical protein
VWWLWVPAFAGTTAERSRVLLTIKKYAYSEIMLDFTCSVIILTPSRSKFEGRLPEAFCRRGTGAAPASEGLTQPSSPGRTRAASSGTSDPARSDHGQRHKGQDAALARRKARGASQVHLIVRSNPDTPPGAIRANAPCRRAIPLDCEGDGRSGMRATPWPRAANRGRFSFDSNNRTTSSRPRAARAGIQ